MNGAYDKNGKMPHKTDKKSNEIDYTCNFFGIRLPFLGMFGNVAGFTGFYSAGALTTQTLAAYIGSQIPTLEKQFGLSSQESGTLMTFNDIGFLLCILFVSAIPRLVHVPRWLFGTMLLFSVSGLICSLPHFIFPTQSFLKSTNNLTQFSKSPSSSFSLCSNEPVHNQTTGNDVAEAYRQTARSAIDPSMKAVSLALIGIGMALQGVAKAPRAAFTTVYLDDGCDKRKTGFFIGIIIGSSIFGPAIAFGLGGLFSRIYVTLEDVDMSPKDPRWIGAWWLGFIVFGCLTFVAALPMLCFPRYLADKNSSNYADKDKSPPANEIPLTRMQKVKERTLSYIRVIKSPVYVCTLTFNILNWSAIVGKFSFLTKYISAQYGVPLWKANIIMSAANLATLTVGTILGGTITRRVNMSPRRCYQVIILLFVIQTIFVASEFFLGCTQPNIIGPGRSVDVVSNITDQCHCKPDNYFPVCGSNQMTYHSPCYAGCLDTQRNGRAFINCTVIPDGQASAGLCPFDCNMLYPYIAVNVIGSFAGALSIMPTFTAKIRSVQDRDKGAGIGLQSTLASLVAAIPVPILFGKIIDTTCLIWSSNNNRRGACALYNIEDFRFRMLGVVMLYKMVALLFSFLCLKLVWNITDWNELTKGRSSTRDNDEKVKLVVIKGSDQGDKVRSVV